MSGDLFLKEKKNQMVKELMPEVVRALLTSRSNNGKHAKDQTNVITQVASLALEITTEFVEQIYLENEQDDFKEEMIWSFLIGSLSHPADALGFAKDVKDFVNSCMINGNTITKYSLVNGVS